MSKISKPRGTYDLFGKELDLFSYVSDSLRMISTLYNFKEIMTPIFEHKELFVRNIGENSDIVTKEFYDFKDKSDRELVLRPENTVAVIRSVVENKMLYKNPLPLKYFYIGPMFRYERPQNGRNRQFFQYGTECIGIKNCYEQVEIIFLCFAILQFFKITKFEFKINYIGGFETRKKWIDSLKKYFEQYKDELTEDSINRLEKNPLRILDDKIDGKKDFVKNSPKVEEFFNEQEQLEFNELKGILDLLKIDYKLDTTLVRGLDYYTGFVFEFVSTSKALTGQSTIIGGGKYSNLTNELGAENYDCIGFAMGIERLMIAIEDENPNESKDHIDIYFAPLKNTKIASLLLINTLRAAGYIVESNFNFDKLDKHFKYGEKFNPRTIIIFGENEAKNKQIILKDQLNKKEHVIPIDNMLDEINKIIKKF